jgi:hypothetical protein
MAATMAGLQGDVAALVAQVTTLQGQVAGLGRDMNAGWLVICGARLAPLPFLPVLTAHLPSWPGALVFFMQAGFAMLEAGIVQPKNIANILFKVLVSRLVFRYRLLAQSPCPQNRCPVSNAMSGALAEGITPLLAENTGKIAKPSLHRARRRSVARASFPAVLCCAAHCGAHHRTSWTRALAQSASGF